MNTCDLKTLQTIWSGVSSILQGGQLGESIIRNLKRLSAGEGCPDLSLKTRVGKISQNNLQNMYDLCSFRRFVAHLETPQSDSPSRVNGLLLPKKILISERRENKTRVRKFLQRYNPRVVKRREPLE
ncbi:hypothetical protein PUN28_016932 [Cardiocondyla obscurior]|uniref:Uncharacterized protein n=1 Tax=Cardiocondyla obscurior TaxID=286306 RepID=A0AAW2EQF5_9HYME